MLSIKYVILDYNTLFKYIYIFPGLALLLHYCVFIPVGICLILPPTV